MIIYLESCSKMELEMKKYFSDHIWDHYNKNLINWFKKFCGKTHETYQFHKQFLLFEEDYFSKVSEMTLKMYDLNKTDDKRFINAAHLYKSI